MVDLLFKSNYIVLFLISCYEKFRLFTLLRTIQVLFSYSDRTELIFYVAEPVEGEDNGDPESWRRHGSSVANRSRRKSRVQKQHSYDDEIKNTTTVTNHIATGAPDANLGKKLSLFVG